MTFESVAFNGITLMLLIIYHLSVAWPEQGQERFKKKTPKNLMFRKNPIKDKLNKSNKCYLFLIQVTTSSLLLLVFYFPHPIFSSFYNFCDFLFLFFKYKALCNLINKNRVYISIKKITQMYHIGCIKS